MSKSHFTASPSMVEDGSRLAAANNVVIKCGDCMHFQGSPHPAKGQACNQLGVRKFANAPSCYTANVHVFRKTSPQAFQQLASLVSSFSGSESRVLIGLLRQQSKLDRRGLTFLEKVYFRLGADYLDNYVAAYALGVGPDDSILLVGNSYFANQKTSMVAQLHKESLLLEKEFAKVRESLIGAGKLYEPRKPHRNLGVDTAAYQPPTLETSPEVLEKLAKSPKKARASRSPRSSTNVLEIDLSNV